MQIRQGKTRLGFCSALLFIFAVNVAATDDLPVQFDPFPSAEQRDFTDFDFATYSLPLSKPVETENGFKSDSVQTLEGRVQRQYWFVPSGLGATALQVYANYRKALVSEGFEILYECKASDCGVHRSGWSEPLDSTVATNIDPKHHYYIAAKLASPEVWLGVFVKGHAADLGVEYLIDLIQPAVLQTGKVTISVNDMSRALERSARIALYGIQFDTGKASLRAESAETLDQVRQLLNTQKELSLYVVGHTDDTGDITLNQSLSEARAASVVDALVEQGVEPARLTPFGAGPYSPVSTNRNDQGRSLNRRVELVERLNSQ